MKYARAIEEVMGRVSEKLTEQNVPSTGFEVKEFRFSGNYDADGYKKGPEHGFTLRYSAEYAAEAEKLTKFLMQDVRVHRVEIPPSASPVASAVGNDLSITLVSETPEALLKAFDKETRVLRQPPPKITPAMWGR